MNRISGAVLAGGDSSRMGTDKARLILGGRTLLDRTIAVLLQVADEVLVVGREAEGTLWSRARWFPDDRPELGPLGGLCSALAHMEADALVLVACDHPWLDAKAIARMARMLRGFEAVIPLVDGCPQPTHAAYARRVLPVVRVQLDRQELSMRALASRLHVRWVDGASLDPDLRTFCGANTREEWAEAQRRSGTSQ